MKTTKTAAKATKTVRTVKTGDATKASKEETNVDRRVTSERRDGVERRSKEEPVSEERRLDQERRKTPRRRQIDPTTCERDYSDSEIEFMQAMDDYKRANGRMFPTCSEILEVLRSLGYEKPGPESELAGDDLGGAADAGLAADLDAVASETVATAAMNLEAVVPEAVVPEAVILDEVEYLEQPPANEEI